MKYAKILIALGVVMLTCAKAAWAGTLTPGLVEAYSRLGETEKLPVLVALTPETELSALAESLLRSPHAGRADRRLILRDSLEQASRQAFETVRASLDILQRNGMISRPEQFWITNLFAVEATRAGAELIANFESVAELGLDETITLLEPVESDPAASAMLATEPALAGMGAPAAWAAGFLGDETLIGVVGHPFGPVQPALAERAKGGEPLLASSFCDNAAQTILGCALGCDRQKGDTIGVAPNANWRLLALPCGSAPRISTVLRALQSSQGANEEEVPDVIVQAWQVGDSCASALPDAAWNAFANLEQLGSILIWAAGDQGELGRGAIALPAARVDRDQAFFAVGAVAQDGLTIDSQSSRGPSPCDRKTIKPELTAIGGARSVAESGIVTARGSLIAAGYVAGTVALMRQANPELTAAAAKAALQLSARDLGVTGEDNEFGYGLLDVAAAVTLASSSSKTGAVSGAVRYGSQYVPGARVYLVSRAGSYTASTNREGKFRFGQIPEGQQFALYAARFGYRDYIAHDSVSVMQREEKNVTIQFESGIADDAEVDRGFLFGVAEDNATAGVWTRAMPVVSQEDEHPVQVGEDASAYGVMCFVTGNGAAPDEPAASHDVDGGRTTLRSPLFRLDQLAKPQLSFSYAYSNDRGPQRGGDFFRAQISNDGGATWTNLIQTSVSSDGWQKVKLKIEDFIVPTDQMALQFIAEDNAPPSLVEAAIDDVSVEGEADAPDPPKNLSLSPTDTGVQLTWNKSDGASAYKVYMSGEQGQVFSSENFFTTTPDTALFVPFEQIPYERFYFQVTAVK